jgi:cysteine-rich repeat protein
MFFLAAACAVPDADWGAEKSAYTERCDGAVCADGQSCVEGFCLRPNDADPFYVPQLRCGDGSKQPWEPCDDGNNSNADACVVGCQAARCGDGFLRQNMPPNDVAYESCDDANNDDSDACLSDCREARCGDGALRTDLQPGDVGYELCDDGNRYDRDACIACQPAVCGDGFVQDGVEQCDDANAEPDDACLNDCAAARCGDGVLRADQEHGFPGFEECDDGNSEPDDDCGNDCYRNRRFSGAGGSAQDLGHSCAQIKSTFSRSLDGLYWIDPDAGRAVLPMQVFCDMSTGLGGFTRMILLQPELALWDAWSEGLLGQSEGQEPFALPLALLGVDAQELQFYIARDGRRVTPVMSGFAALAWRPNSDSDSFDEAMSSAPPGGEQQVCMAPLAHVSAHWNWSFASAEGCAAPGASGAVLFGDESGDLVEAAMRFQAPGEALSSSFSILTVWAR